MHPASRKQMETRCENHDTAASFCLIFNSVTRNCFRGSIKHEANAHAGK
jgi:hypothetical protein